MRTALEVLVRVGEKRGPHPPFPISRALPPRAFSDTIDSTIAPSPSSSGIGSPFCVVISIRSSRRQNAARYACGPAPASGFMVILGGRALAARREVLEPFPGRFRNRAGIPHRSLTPVFDVREHDLHAALERHRRLPAEHALDPADVGERAVGLAR